MENTVKYRKFILPIIMGLIFGHLHLFDPDAVDPTAWRIYSAIFVATII